MVTGQHPRHCHHICYTAYHLQLISVIPSNAKRNVSQTTDSTKSLKANLNPKAKEGPTILFLKINILF